MAAYLPGLAPLLPAAAADSHDGEGDRWMTPAPVVRALQQVFPDGFIDPCGDPCSSLTAAAAACLDIRRGEDGLTMRWPDGAAFVNPPYSNASEWIERCAQMASDRLPVVALLPFRAEGLAWHRHVWGKAQVVLPAGRIKFVAMDGQTYGAAQIGTAFVCWGLPGAALACALADQGLTCVVLDVVASDRYRGRR